MEEEIQGKYLGYLDSIQDLIKDIQAGNVQGIPEQKLAELNELYKQAQDRFTQGLGGFQPFVDTATGTIGSGVEALEKAATTFEGLGTAPTREQIDPFINPYQDAIRDEINRAYDIAANTASADAIGAGAFGGGREGIQRAELERNRASALAQAQAQAFLNAQQQLGQRQQTSAAGLGALAPQYGSFGAQQAQLGVTGQQLGSQDINTLLGLGALGQQQAQSSLDVARQNQLSQMYEPYQRVGFLSDIYAGAPTSTQTIQTSTSPAATSSMSPLRTIAGYGVAGLGALSGISGLQGLF